MTKKQAIEILMDGELNPCVAEDREACDMALEALEQEPCEDCISRQIIQIISDYVESHIQEINTGYGDLNKHTNEILRMIVDYIGSIPSVTPQFTEAEIQKMQELEQAEIQKAYELGKAEQLKTGYWVKEKSLHGWDGKSYQCSECGRSIHLDLEVEELNDYPYCHCGAKMAESEE